MEGGFRFDFGEEDTPVVEVQEQCKKNAHPPPLAWSYSEDEATTLVRELGEEDLSVQKEGSLKLIRLQPALLPSETCAFAEELKQRDIIPGVYEGGFKLWSCAGDLVRYLVEKKVALEGKKVLEAGCGHGAPSIHSLLQGASRVVMQDYNVEVIRLLTAPNVLLNTKMEPEPLMQRCEFWGGDWTELSSKCAEQAGTFDVILTTDTLYTVEVVAGLLGFLRTFLAADGTAYVGSKTVCGCSPAQVFWG